VNKSFFLALTIFTGSTFLLGSCQNSTVDSTESEIHEERDPRFAPCYTENELAQRNCDSVLTAFFGTKATTHLKLNKELSFIGCDESDNLEMLAFGDKSCCNPRTYDLVYDMIIKGDTVYRIPMLAGSEMQFNFASEGEKSNLFAYKRLLNGEIEFDYAALKAEMIRKNLNPDMFEIELFNDTQEKSLENSLYWEIYYVTEDDAMLVTRVNARNGVFSPIRPITRMGD